MKLVPPTKAYSLTSNGHWKYHLLVSDKPRDIQGHTHFKTACGLFMAEDLIQETSVESIRQTDLCKKCLGAMKVEDTNNGKDT